MLDWLKDIVLLALGGVGTAVWFFWRRRAEQTPVFENIQKAEKLLSLQRELDKTNYSIEDLRRLENVLMGRAEVARELSLSFEQQAKDIHDVEFNSAMTQREMNIVATQAYKRAEQKLEIVVTELKEYLSPEEIIRLNEVNDVWRDYQRKHADFAALQHEGGSIQPLVYASALESATVARVVELEIELKQLKSTCVPYHERGAI